MSVKSKSNKTSRPLTGESENVLVPRYKDFLNAKSFLLQPSEKTGISLYDFLVLLIRKLYEEKSQNKPINFEELCRKVKQENYIHKSSTIKSSNEPSMEFNLAELQKSLFENASFNLHHIEDDFEEKSKLPNLMQTFFYFEQAQIGINREEIIRLWLAMRHLVESQPIAIMRFWGKIFGTEKNYYVVEAEMIEGKDNYLDEFDLQKQSEENSVKKEIKKPIEIDEDIEIIDEPPKSEWKPPVVIPFEENGNGLNKKVYYVCNIPGEEWQRLPKVTPAQITNSRLIRKYLTGELNAKIESYPPFPGKEKHFLRAVISRITATTNISPLGFYRFDEDEEEAEEEENGSRSKFVEDSEFEPIPLKDLIDPSFANWVHHGQYILPQGRTSWWNPTSKNTEEIEEEDEEEEKEEMDEPEPESGPPLLTPISEDEEINGIPAWSAKLSSNIVPQYSVAVLSSNLWPGAHAFATGKTFDNIYIGWGLKYVTPNHNPLALAPVQIEFPSGPEVTEIEDPTPDEEAAARAAEAQAAEQAEEAEEAEEEEEEGEEEDD